MTTPQKPETAQRQEICPVCDGPLQEFQTLDSDDKIIDIVRKCKRKFNGMKKKGCGYTAQRQER